LELRHGRRLG